MPDLGVEDEELEEVPPEEEEPEVYDEKFASTLSEKFGLTPQDLKEGIQFIKDLRVAQRKEVEKKLLDTARQQLSEFWNVDEDSTVDRMQEVSKYWNKMPAEKRKLYDNVEGAQIIWATISKKKATKPVTSKSTANPKGKKLTFLKSDIDKMSREEYAEKYSQILEAYRNNLVG